MNSTQTLRAWLVLAVAAAAIALGGVSAAGASAPVALNYHAAYFHQLQRGTLVTFTGKVSRRLQKTFFIVMQDGDYNRRVYVGFRHAPQLLPGDRVRVTGEFWPVKDGVYVQHASAVLIKAG